MDSPTTHGYSPRVPILSSSGVMANWRYVLKSLGTGYPLSTCDQCAFFAYVLKSTKSFSFFFFCLLVRQFKPETVFRSALTSVRRNQRPAVQSGKETLLMDSNSTETMKHPSSSSLQVSNAISKISRLNPPATLRSQQLPPRKKTLNLPQVAPHFPSPNPTTPTESHHNRSTLGLLYRVMRDTNYLILMTLRSW